MSYHHITYPIKTVSETNQRDHWRVAHARHAAQRLAGKALTKSSLNAGAKLPPKPWLITMTRVGKNLLDEGNLSASMKHVQDGMCEALGIDDGDRAHKWKYEQRTGKPYCVEARIEPLA